MRITILTLVTMILIASSSSSGEKPTDKEKGAPTRGSKLMVEKLKNAQTLLEGLATNDFEKITASTSELIRISKEAEFFSAHKTPMYEVHTNNFRRAAETIMQKAKDKNLEGATLAYVDMTVTCIRCHQHTREIRNTSLPLPPNRSVDSSNAE